MELLTRQDLVARDSVQTLGKPASPGRLSCPSKKLDLVNLLGDPRSQKQEVKPKVKSKKADVQQALSGGKQG